MRACVRGGVRAGVCMPRLDTGAPGSVGWCAVDGVVASRAEVFFVRPVIWISDNSGVADKMRMAGDVPLATATRVSLARRCRSRCCHVYYSNHTGGWLVG